MNTPKMIEKVILTNKDEFIQKFGDELVEEMLTDKKALKSMVENFNMDFMMKDMIEDAIACFVLEK